MLFDVRVKGGVIGVLSGSSETRLLPLNVFVGKCPFNSVEFNPVAAPLLVTASAGTGVQ